MNDSITPTTVVTSIIVQNTRPTAFQSPQAKYICIPNMVNMNSTMNSLKPNERTNFGIGRWGEYFERIRSYRLPRGQALPHHQRPRLMAKATGAIMHISASSPIIG